jgi:Arc/MetJ-type ribon-helix-helix transcriptional regulator
VSIDDDELIDFIDEMHGEDAVYENRSELFRKALRKFQDDYGEALKQLKDDSGENQEFV